MPIIKAFFIMAVCAASSVAVARRVVTLAEKHRILADELAKTIVTKVVDTSHPEVISELGEIIFQQQRGFLLKVSTVGLQEKLELDVIKLRRAEAELSSVEEEDIRILEEEDTPTSRLFAAVQLDANSVYASVAEARNVLARKRSEVEAIAAIGDTAARHEAYADYSAETTRKSIEGYLLMTKVAAASEHAPAQEDVESIIKSKYLNDLLAVELEALATKLGRDDLLEIQTGIDVFVRDGKALRE